MTSDEYKYWQYLDNQLNGDGSIPNPRAEAAAPAPAAPAAPSKPTAEDLQLANIMRKRGPLTTEERALLRKGISTCLRENGY
jgi:hypothetical protein